MGALASAASSLKDIPAAAGRTVSSDTSKLFDIAKLNIGATLLAPLEGILPALFATPIIGSFLGELGQGKKDKDKPLTEDTGEKIKEDTQDIPEVKVSIAALDEKHFPETIKLLSDIKNFAERILSSLDEDFKAEREAAIEAEMEADRLAAQQAETNLEKKPHLKGPSATIGKVKKKIDLKSMIDKVMSMAPIFLASIGAAIMTGLTTAFGLLLNPAVIAKAVGKVLLRASPLALITTGLAALSGAITSFFESEKTTFIGKIGDALGGAVGQIVEFISFGLISKEQVMGILEPLTNIYEGIGLFLKDISVDKVIGTFKTAWIDFKGSISDAIDLLPSSEQIMEVISEIADSIGLTGLRDTITNLIPRLNMTVTDVFDKLMNAFSGLINLLPKALRRKVGLLSIQEEDVEIEQQLARAERQRQDNINENANRSSVARGLEKRIVELKERGRSAKEIAMVEQQLREARVGLGGVTGDKLDVTPVEQQTFEIAGKTYTGAELKERLASRVSPDAVGPSPESIALTESKVQQIEQAQLDKSVTSSPTIVNNNNITNAPVQQIGGSTQVHNIVQGSFSGGGGAIPTLV